MIDGQTAETLVQGSNPAEESSQHPIATPFARASVHRSIGGPLLSALLLLPFLKHGKMCDDIWRMVLEGQ